MSKKSKKQKQDAVKLNILKTLDLLEEDDAQEREEERMAPGFSVDYRAARAPEKAPPAPPKAEEAPPKAEEGQQESPAAEAPPAPPKAEEERREPPAAEAPPAPPKAEEGRREPPAAEAPPAPPKAEEERREPPAAREPEQKPPDRRPGIQRVETEEAETGNFVIRKTANGATIPVRAAAREGEPVVGTAGHVSTGPDRAGKNAKGQEKPKKKIVDFFDKNTRQENTSFFGWFERPEPEIAPPAQKARRAELRAGGDEPEQAQAEPDQVGKKGAAARNPVVPAAPARGPRGVLEKRRVNLAVSSFSADYRRNHDQEADPSLENDTEIDDFMAGAAEDDRLLVKGAPVHEDPAPPAGEEERQEARRAPRRGKYRYGVVMGSFVLLLALVGVAFIAATVGRQIYITATDDSQERAYDTFLIPVVMQDPEPFEDSAKADETFVLTASLWKAITANEGTNYSEYDESGRALVPLGDVVDACHELFGPDCQLQPKTPAEETFYEYNAVENKFHVALYSSDSTYAPYTEKITREGETLVLRVGYVSPSDEWRNQATSEVSGPTPVKYMEYVMRQNQSTGKYYIAALREAA